MAKIVVIRHGKSVGNEIGVIQGNKDDYSLTIEGEKQASEIFDKNNEALLQAKEIVSSPLKRAIETAQIVNSSLKLPLTINEQVREFDPGILAGMKKADVEKKYPNLFKIWQDRGDLDLIPQAESGEQLQARVLSFLMQYRKLEDASIIVVTHAGFIRTLINTIDGQNRTNNFEIPNAGVFVRENIFSKLNISPKSRAMSSEVYVLDTADGKYVIKIKDRSVNEEDYAEQDILNSIDFHKDSLPQVLNLTDYSNGYSCKVLKFVGGEHKYGKLSKEERIALISTEKELADKLKNEPVRAFRKKDILGELKVKVDLAKNEYVKELAQTLLATGENLRLQEREDVLAHSDLNRDNILFNKNGNGNIEVNIIDWESLEYAPEGYQLASLLASGFLLEGEDINDILDIIKNSGRDLDEMLYLMHVRIFNGLFFFAESRDESITRAADASKDLLKRYFIASEKIEMTKKLIKSKSGVRRDEKIIYR